MYQKRSFQTKKNVYEIWFGKIMKAEYLEIWNVSFFILNQKKYYEWRFGKKICQHVSFYEQIKIILKKIIFADCCLKKCVENSYFAILCIVIVDLWFNACKFCFLRQIYHYEDYYSFKIKKNNDI